MFDAWALRLGVFVENSQTRLPSNLGKRVPFFCLKGFIREPKPPKRE